MVKTTGNLFNNRQEIKFYIYKSLSVPITFKHLLTNGAEFLVGKTDCTGPSASFPVTDLSTDFRFPRAPRNPPFLYFQTVCICCLLRTDTDPW